MSIDIKEFQKLKDAVDDARRKADKAAGVEEQIKSDMQKEFKVSTLKAAKNLRDEIKEEFEALEEKYEAALARIKEEFGDKLEGSADEG
jgi:predicted transcriptional regulator